MIVVASGGGEDKRGSDKHAITFAPRHLSLSTSSSPLSLPLPLHEPSTRAEAAAVNTNVGTPTEVARRITAIFDAHYDAIWRTLRRLGVSESEVDDAAQRVFLVATRRLDTIIEGHEGRYLYGIAIRMASEVRRRDPRRREVSDAVLAEVADDAPGPEEALLEHEAKDALDEALAGMPDDLREVLVLVEIEDLAAPEVAAMLEIPIGTVASRLRRAREAFTMSARRVRARFEQQQTLTGKNAKTMQMGGVR